MPPKFLCWSPNFHCNGMRRCGLWELTWFTRGHEYGASEMEFVSLGEEGEA